MFYVFLGSDELTKAEKIAELKKKYLGSSDAQKFDLEVCYAEKLDPATLQKALLALPAIASKRVIILYNCHKLDSSNKELLIDFISSPKSADAVLIMEDGSMKETDTFIKKIRPYAKVISYVSSEPVSVFDMTRAISQKQPSKALQLLSDLLASGVHPLQIMGALIWFWGKSRWQLSQAAYAKGLQYMQQADMDIKRSRLRPEYAMERLVVRLCLVR